MLVFIGLGVAALVVIQILFHLAFAIGIAAKEREGGNAKIDFRAAGRAVDQNGLPGLYAPAVAQALQSGHSRHWQRRRFPEGRAFSLS
jgi:hypothetical protein